jgi:hypothetical protein
MAVLDTAIFFYAEMPASSAGMMRKGRAVVGREGKSGLALFMKTGLSNIPFNP